MITDSFLNFPACPELSALRSLFSDLKGNLPCVEQDLRSLVGSQKSLSSVIEKLSALIHVCGSELHIQTLFQDDVRQVYHRECPIGDGPVLGSGPKNVLFEYQEAIEDSVSCDRQCQEVAITPANMEKHATISGEIAISLLQSEQFLWENKLEQVTEKKI